MLYASAQVQEIQLDYTTCSTDAPTDTFAPMPSESVFSQFKSNNTINASWQRKVINVTYDGVPTLTNQCDLKFDVPEAMGPPVLFYYHLTNFYQNHRRYVNSFFDKQLKGDAEDGAAVNGSNCSPLTNDEQGRLIYPCGLIANSLFNDTFSSPTLLNLINSTGDNETYVMQDTSNIAWASDTALYGKTKYTDWSTVVPPPNWAKRYPNGYSDNWPPPDLGTNQSFMVWMRTAGLPSFSKLAQRNDTAPMQEGTYTVTILDSMCILSSPRHPFLC